MKREEVRQLDEAGLRAYVERVWREFDAALALLDDDDYPWLGMDRDARGHARTLIAWALEGRERRLRAAPGDKEA